MQEMGDHHLNFGGMLGGRSHEHRTVLAWLGPRGLSFKIKVVLTAQLELVLDRQRRVRELLLYGPAADVVRFVLETAGRDGLRQGEDRWQRFVIDDYSFRSRPAGFLGFANDQGNDLPMVKHIFVSQ